MRRSTAIRGRAKQQPQHQQHHDSSGTNQLTLSASFARGKRKCNDISCSDNENTTRGASSSSVSGGAKSMAGPDLLNVSFVNEQMQEFCPFASFVAVGHNSSTAIIPPTVHANQDTAFGLGTSMSTQVPIGYGAPPSAGGQFWSYQPHGCGQQTFLEPPQRKNGVVSRPILGVGAQCSGIVPPSTFTSGVLAPAQHQLVGGCEVRLCPLPPSRDESLAYRTCRRTSLPALQWTDSDEVWRLMCNKDVVYRRDPALLQRHPTIHVRMRAILFDWLTEVCEVYKLHRETYHLAVDFVDRFLSNTESGLAKHTLQLVGVTALFIAAKLEEIYPPKLSDFAYVTDGACTEQQILQQEVVMLTTLKWCLSPLTPNNWLCTFLQSASQFAKPTASDHQFEIPRFPVYTFLKAAQLIDLCLLDPESLQFSYSALAAAAMFHMHEEPYAAIVVSGYEWSDIQRCVSWMDCFVKVILEKGILQSKYIPDVPHDAQHNIQTHGYELAVFDRVRELKTDIENALRFSPILPNSLAAIFPTPPNSDERPVSSAIPPRRVPTTGELHTLLYKNADANSFFS